MVSRFAKLYVIAGTALVVVSFLAFFFMQPNVSPEFTGSSELVFSAEVSMPVVEAALDQLPYEREIARTADANFKLTTRALSEEEYIALIAAIEKTFDDHEIVSYRSFSPTISQELVRKSVIALLIGAFIVILYISYTFRKVSRPVASWRYGVVSTVTLFHDVSIPLGVFALIAPYTDAAIDTLFVAALLATLGYSINDTIVIFDRIRERLQVNSEKKRKEDFATVVDYGVRKSVRRSLYTSVSTMLPLMLLLLLVPVTKWFAVALFIGIVAGTYSSLFFAPSLLLLWHTMFPQELQRARKMTETERADLALQKTLRRHESR